MADSKKNGEKILYLEVLRVLAICFVIFNHTGKYGFFLFAEWPLGSLPFWLYSYVSLFCKFAVPVFFGISGILMLGKPAEPLKKIFMRVGKILLILVVYSLLYYLYDLYNRPWLDFSFEYYWQMLYSANLKYHLWYLYAYVAFLLTVPFVQAMVKNMENRHFYYMFALAIVFGGVVPTLEYWLNRGAFTMNDSLRVKWLFSSAVLYPCVGYFIHNRIDIKKCTKALIGLWILNIGTIMLEAYLTYHRMDATGVLLEWECQDYFELYAVVNCATVMLTVRWVMDRVKLPVWVKKIIVSLGSCTFGIYLWHTFFRDFVIGEEVLFDNAIASMRAIGMNFMLTTWIACFAVLILSYVVTWILSKIPILRKLVGFK